MKACLRTYGWAIASGILLSWALPNFHWFPLAWVGLIPLLYNTRSTTAKVSAARFFVAGWVFNSIVLQWLIGNVFWAGGWAILGQQGVCLALSVYWALLGALWSRMNTRLPVGLIAPAFGLCWIAMEWLQARLFSGLGWAALGYSQGPDIWFSQVAALGGVSLLSGILVTVNVWLTQAVADQSLRLRSIAAALVLAVVAHGVGMLLLDSPDENPDASFSVGIYQSNYAQHMKWDPHFEQTMLDMAITQSTVVSENESVDLFIWPEALIMNEFRAPRTLRPLQEFVAKTDVPLFTGAVRRENNPSRAFNASALITPNGDYSIYDKMKLAPFGEYIPFESYLSFARGMGAGGGITPGDRPYLFSVGDRTFGPLICFEVLFAPLADERRALGADFLVVITNLGWFGGSNVLSQELEIARFRAIENRLPLVQAANTGVSGVIDPWGRIRVIDGVITVKGRYLTWDTPPPRSDAMMQRRVGALPLPEAAALPLPGSVRWFGRLATVGGLALALALCFLPARQKAPEAP